MRIAVPPSLELTIDLDLAMMGLGDRLYNCEISSGSGVDICHKYISYPLPPGFRRKSNE